MKIKNWILNSNFNFQFYLQIQTRWIITKDKRHNDVKWTALQSTVFKAFQQRYLDRSVNYWICFIFWQPWGWLSWNIDWTLILKSLIDFYHKHVTSYDKCVIYRLYFRRKIRASIGGCPSKNLRKSALISKIGEI